MKKMIISMAAIGALAFGAIAQEAANTLKLMVVGFGNVESSSPSMPLSE